MTKPRQDPGAARQWGVINNILKSSSQKLFPSQPTRRPERAGASRWRAHSDGGDGRQLRPHNENQSHDQRHASKERSRGDQSTLHRQAPRRSRSPQRTSATHVDPHSDRSHYRAENRRENQRLSHLPELSQRLDQSPVRSYALKPVDRSDKSSTADQPTNKDRHEYRPSSGKRKHTTADDGNNPKRIKHVKKQQVARHDVEQLEQPLPRLSVSPQPVTKKSEAISTTPIVKNQLRSDSETPSQLLTPPSSNGSPEHETKSGQPLGTECISTPTPVSRARTEREVPSPMGIKYALSKKRQRDEDIDPPNESKRLRHSKTSRLAESQHQPVAELTSTPQQTSPPAQMKARAVQPDSSFAPVTPNYGCELTFLDYNHDSVPVLYSSMINHDSDADFLNSPSGTLVVNALAVIGPSVDPLAIRGWPSTINLPGDTSDHKTFGMVLSGVDLYLHENDSELHVATDRGLVTVTSYLQLMGVPKEQPVSFKGCVPSWARAVFRTPGRRRIVLPKEGKDPRKFEIVSKHAALGSHQIALTLNSHVEVADERQNLEEWEKEAESQAQVKPDRRLVLEGSMLEKEMRPRDENGYPVPGLDEKLILSADLGHLPLRAGSVVLIYAIDDDNVWAYGRLKDTDKMGRFPIEHICPVDWSQDELTKANDNLTLALPKPEDPGEQHWTGLYHWLRQGGFAFGPTWKETLEAIAAKARHEYERNLAARKSWTETRSTFIPEVHDAPTEQSVSQKPTSDNSSPAVIAISHTAHPTTAVQSATAERELEKVTSELVGASATLGAKSLVIEGDRAVIPADLGCSVSNVSRAEVETIPSAEIVQDTDVIGTAKSLENEHQRAVGVSDGHRMPEAMEHEEEEIEDKPGLFEPVDHAEGQTGLAASEDVEQGVETESPEEAVRAETEIAGTPTHQGSFSKVRLDLWARNDDIEYDWGDSDEEL